MRSIKSKLKVKNADDIVQLHQRINDLSSRVRKLGAKRMEAWASLIERESFRPAAENLAYYLALRSENLSGLQLELSEKGLSSLGRCEADVLGSLDAVNAALSRISGAEPIAFPPAGWKRQRDVPLRDQVEGIFGHDPTGPRSRIMVTLGTDAAHNPTLVEDMIKAGADCVRINCAHDGPDVWRGMIVMTRQAAAKVGRHCRVLMDLAGPKIRIEELGGRANKRLRLGDRFLLMANLEKSDDQKGIVVVANEAEPLRLLKKGHKVLIDDGKISCFVEKKLGGKVSLKIDAVRPKGVKLRPGKGLHFPDLNLSIPPLTTKDLVDLDFVAEHADMIGYSFVQRVSDIHELQEELTKRLGDKPMPPLILKVETRLGVASLPELIVAAASKQPTAVMIARGDLAVELGLQHMSEVQEQLLWLCEAAHVPVVWATQVLDSLLKTGIPSRAEATDAAMAQRAECVMLNKGAHVVDTIRFLDNILHRMDRHVAKKSALLGPLSQWAAPRANSRSK